jgi:hypothetical protein
MIYAEKYGDGSLETAFRASDASLAFKAAALAGKRYPLQ